MGLLIVYWRLAIVQLALTLPLVVFAGSPSESAAEYSGGLKAAQSGDYESAIPSLLSSYQSKADALTAYALSVCYAHVNDYNNAVEYSLRALEALPSLPAAYVQPAKDIITWAEETRRAMVSSGSVTIATLNFRDVINNGRESSGRCGQSTSGSCGSREKEERGIG